MTGLTSHVDELRTLADLACDDALQPHHIAQLEQLLRGDVRAQEFYLAHLCFDRRLRWVLTHQMQEPVAPPLLSFLSPVAHNAIGYFSDGMPLAYLLATVITGLGLVIGSMIYVSAPEQNGRLSTALVAATKPEFVGKITGMVDCEWKAVPSGRRLVASGRNSKVALGDKVALASGLMEITYDTGAKVILQGPVTYEVELNGGYLAVGKLTGKLEKGSGFRGQGSETENQKSSLATNHWPLATSSNPFVIRTPRAIITDLGTEFGVEVNGSGVTETHVFAGTVKMAPSTSSKDEQPSDVLLHAGQIARCDRQAVRLVGNEASASGDRFVRHIVRSDLKQIVERFEGLTIGREFEQMPAGRYVAVPGGFAYREPGLDKGKRTRGYIRTVATDFCNRDFVFEATVDVQLGERDEATYPHWIFFGIGDGAPNADFYDEPGCALALGLVMDQGRACLRLCQPDVKIAANHELDREVAPPKTFKPGKYRVRISKTGNWIRYAITADTAGGQEPAFLLWANLKTAAPLLNTGNSRLFVGTGYCDTMTVRFEKLSVTYTANGQRAKEVGEPQNDRPQSKTTSGPRSVDRSDPG